MLSARSITDDEFEAAYSALMTDGYAIFENVLPQKDVDSLRAALAPYLGGDLRGRNDFEGLKSNRVYGLLAKDPIFAELVTHDLPMRFVERALGESCLLSACLAINLLPGESAQPWHQDDGHIHIPNPKPVSGISTFWTIDAMTEDNGATEILPGSHLWDDAKAAGLADEAAFYSQSDPNADADAHRRTETRKMTMPAGSLMMTCGNLWHRGGANRSDAPRLIITPQYCAGWARPLETMTLAVPPDIARTLPERAQQLLGYSIHPPFMGYVDGVHPAKSLQA